MTHEHETTVELMGINRPALVRYFPDPGDGYPVIEAVEVGRRIRRIGYTEHVFADIYPILDESDLLRLEQSICEARPIWRETA
jgi:hypothetical protein